MALGLHPPQGKQQLFVFKWQMAGATFLHFCYTVNIRNTPNLGFPTAIILSCLYSRMSLIFRNPLLCACDLESRKCRRKKGVNPPRPSSPCRFGSTRTKVPRERDTANTQGTYVFYTNTRQELENPGIETKNHPVPASPPPKKKTIYKGSK